MDVRDRLGPDERAVFDSFRRLGLSEAAAFDAVFNRSTVSTLGGDPVGDLQRSFERMGLTESAARIAVGGGRRGPSAVQEAPTRPPGPAGLAATPLSSEELRDAIQQAVEKAVADAVERFEESRRTGRRGAKPPKDATQVVEGGPGGPGSAR